MEGKAQNTSRKYISTIEYMTMCPFKIISKNQANKNAASSKLLLATLQFALYKYMYSKL